MTRTVALDVEVADTRRAGSLCSVGVCTIEEGRIGEEFYTLCNPGVPFDAFCVRVHGITEEMVQDAPDLENVLAMLTPYLEDSLMVAHNAPFDAGQLRAAARRAGVALPSFETCCTVQLARKVFPGRSSYKLSSLQDLIGMPFEHHNALWDAKACAQIYLRCQREQARERQVQQLSMDFKMLFAHRRSRETVQSSPLTDGTFGGFGIGRPHCGPQRTQGLREKERSNFMKTKAVRMYGVNDLRLEEFELPEIKDDEILAKIITDSVCMSSYKAAIQGSNHKRVPDDIDVNPVIIGHEFAGVIEKVGKKWQGEWKIGDAFAIQPALNLPGDFHTPGYSYPYFGGDMTYCVIPKEVMEQNCLLHYEGKGFFNASLGEPMSCIIGASHATYHTKPGVYVHEMGIKKNGIMALLACAGPMGLGANDNAMHADLHQRRASGAC